MDTPKSGQPPFPNGHPAYKITSDNGQRTLRTRGNAEKCIIIRAHNVEKQQTTESVYNAK